MNERRSLLLLLGIFLTLLFLELPGSWLFEPDEARYAEIPHEMLVTGDFVTPRLNGSHYFEKPPFLYWANAASMKAIGETPFAARLPTRIAAAGTVIVLAVALGASSAPWTGLWAALLYISAMLPFALGRINITDGFLTFFITAALLGIRSLLRRKEAGQASVLLEIVTGLSLALAVLTKGLIGLVIPALVVLTWGAALRRWRAYRHVLLSWIPVIFLFVAAPWFVLVERANPGFSKFFFIHEHFQRYATNVSDRPGPIYYFVATFIAGLLPWTWLFGEPLAGAFRGWRSSTSEKQDDLFFGFWVVIVVGFFSLSHSKLIPYVLPAFPPAAALLGQKVARQSESSPGPWKMQAWVMTVLAIAGITVGWHSGLIRDLDLRFSVVLLAVFIVGGAWAAAALARRGWRVAVMAQATAWLGFYGTIVCAIPRLAKAYSDRDVAYDALLLDADEVVNILSYSQSFPWVLRHPIPVVEFRGELASDGQRNPDLFWDEKKFWSRWNSKERVVAGIRQENLDIFWPDVKKPVVLARSRRMLIVANFDPVQGPKLDLVGRQRD